ncbi:MAG: N-acetyltransferase [Bacteroidales bacterium]|nr:N-acetyltransferase [Bacteroidales bacterium]
MNFTYRKFKPDDRKAILNVLNYYVKNSFAAYPQEQLESGHFDKLFEAADKLPFYVIFKGEKLIGFGLLRPYYKLSTFKHTVEITYFILPDYTMKGLGSKLLNLLEEDARKLGIESILANISSQNPQSINFHMKYGFVQCGRFEKVGKKFGKSFDVIWMQKFL